MSKTDPRCPEWARLHDEGRTWAELSAIYDEGQTMIRKSVRGWRRSLPDAESFDGEDTTKGDLIFEDKKPLPSEGDVKALLDAYLNVIDKSKPMSTRQREATVAFKNAVPTGIVFFGDGHIGSWGWAARRQMEDLRLVANTDGLFPVFMGDDWDNFVFDFAKWASVMPPSHQRAIGHYMMKLLFPKTIAVVGGNHLEWTKKVADIDLSAELAVKSDAVFLGTRGDLFARLGDQEYHLFLHHRARGGSTLNKSNSARVASDDIGGADIIVEADKHDPWIHTEYKARKRQVWLRTGTYKIEDEYPDEIDFPQGKWDMPMVLIYPDRRRVVPFMDFRDGLATLEAERAKYLKG